MLGSHNKRERSKWPERFQRQDILRGICEGGSVQGIGVGRLHVSQTRAEPTNAEMELARFRPPKPDIERDHKRTIASIQDLLIRCYGG